LFTGITENYSLLPMLRNVHKLKGMNRKLGAVGIQLKIRLPGRLGEYGPGK
jgi:hypothetical protein